MKRTSHMLRLAAAIAFVPSLAFAALGGDVASVQADQARMKASLRVARTAEKYTVHEIQASSGTTVREYVAANGTVFGVAWQGPTAPNLQQILGQYFTPFTEAAHSKHSSHSQLLIQQPGLVVHVGGHMRAFAGSAYVPQMLPAGVSADEIN